MLKLIPKNETFFVQLENLGRCALESANGLSVVVGSDDMDAVHAAAAKLVNAKQSAKTEFNAITEAICRTLITPFDREDMQDFAYLLYHVPKQIEKIKERMLTHGIRDFNGDLSRFTIIIDREAAMMSEILQSLSGKLNTRAIQAKVAVMHELEDQGDKALGSAIADGFYSVADTRELMIRKDLYEMLESVTDLFRDAANVAMRIVLKHS